MSYVSCGRHYEGKSGSVAVQEATAYYENQNDSAAI
jgi:hypothetical protein